MEYSLLLVEDEPGLVLTLSDLLSADGYHVEAASDGLLGLQMAERGSFSLIILDVMLPGRSGFDVCRDLRQNGIQTPILMLTARGQIVDKVLGFKLGADDYLTKPFEPLELLARVHSLLRRSVGPSIRPGSAFRFGSVIVDFRATQVSRAGQKIELSAREYELLCHFIRQQGATLSRDELLKEVWGYEPGLQTRTVDVHVGRLRKGHNRGRVPDPIRTVRGAGYAFNDRFGKVA